MPYIPRELEGFLMQALNWFPAISLTGPRQSGKSTLLRTMLPDYAYVNLEDPQLRAQALTDPVGFIRDRPSQLIIDEAQYAPDLFSMVQVVSDERGKPGQYVLSGSQNFLLLKHVTQSLAGRAGLLKLLPFSFHEARQADPSLPLEAFAVRGGYPRLYDVDVPPAFFFESYLDTYIQRDVGEYLDVRNLTSFRAFLTACASTCGGLLNSSALGNQVDVTFKTVKAWLSMLESSYVLFRLEPFYRNVKKRLTKTPKVYFYDTGLLCYLLGIRTAEELVVHPSFGAIFENLVVAEVMKRHLNRGVSPQLYFYRDDSKLEVDLLDFTDPAAPQAVEIKASATYREKFGRVLNHVCDEIGVAPEGRLVVCRVAESYNAQGLRVCNATDWLLGQ